MSERETVFVDRQCEMQDRGVASLNAVSGKRGRETEKRLRTICRSCSGSVAPSKALDRLRGGFEKPQAASTRQQRTSRKRRHLIMSTRITSLANSGRNAASKHRQMM